MTCLVFAESFGAAGVAPAAPSVAGVLDMGKRKPKIRKAALTRDGYRCQMLRDGRKCGRPAVHANHKQRQRDGGMDTLSNLEAACAECNCRDGGHAAHTASDVYGCPPPARLTHIAALVVSVLDTAMAPNDVGRHSARKLLAAYQFPRRVTDVEVDAACLWRRWRFHQQTASRW